MIVRYLWVQLTSWGNFELIIKFCINILNNYNKCFNVYENKYLLQHY